ncbi:TonB-dependent receptor [Pseudomonas sp. 13B_2.1_Bac1]|uniref:TonB-dependent receptor n=1 Tax=Pseudomonas sp. 13B_2.1_Bac1 TaxID=2971624 RepID=UPI0021C74B81|nr:TonB-dependent receptor [Pseudomonas sp. 13B_2.1_Bac1]MCU1785277.1 TonB-dependent receptor [Pseudomonas sp. 13B_2.1_Bac1]
MGSNTLRAAPFARRPLHLALVSVLTLFSGIAGAVDATGNETADQPGKDKKEAALDTVTVTAERRTTDIQKTAVAVSAVGESQLQERQVHTLADLAGQAAGLTLPSPYINQQYVFIRGIGNSRPAGNPSVGVYLDDVYVARQFGNAYSNLPDIERVEILRGPQGTLYGQNTSSGAIKIISRDPSEQFTGSVEAGAGNYGTFESKGYFSGALIPEVLLGSLAVSSRRSDGYAHNYTLHKDVNGFDTDQVRGKLLFRPTDSLRFDLAIDEANDNSDNGVPSPLTPHLKDNRTLAAWDTRTDQKNGGVSFKITDQLNDHLTFKSISAFRRIKDGQPWDSDGRETYTFFKFYQDVNQRQSSQEFQLLGEYDRFDFVTGATYFHEHFDFDRLSALGAAPTWQVTRSRNEKESKGVFGQLHYKVTDAFGITGGLRYSREEHILDGDAYDSNANGDFLNQRFAFKDWNEKNSAVTPKLTLDYTFNPGLFTYFTWAKGETSGGWNPAPSNRLDLIERPIDPEEVTSYEWGIKTTAFNNRVQNNIALFYNNYENYQTNLSNPVFNGVPVVGAVLANADSAHTYGAELESSVQITPNWKTSFSASYLRATIDQFLPDDVSSLADYTGNQLPFAPRMTYNLNTVYDLSVPGGDLRLNGNVRRSSKFYTGVENTYETPAQTYVDLGAFYTPRGTPLTLFVTGKNLFDKTYETPSQYGYTYNSPRTWLAGARYDF